MIVLELFNKKAYGICKVPEEALPIVLKRDPSFMEHVIEVNGEYTNDADYDVNDLKADLESVGFEVELFNIEDTRRVH